MKKKENIEVNICLNYIHKELFINFFEEDIIYKKIEERVEEINTSLIAIIRYILLTSLK